MIKNKNQSKELIFKFFRKLVYVPTTVLKNSMFIMIIHYILVIFNVLYTVLNIIKKYTLLNLRLTTI